MTFREPTGVLTDITKLPVEELTSLGIRWFWFDLDRTVFEHGGMRASPEYDAFFEEIVQAGGKICFPSNNPKKRPGLTTCDYQLFCPRTYLEWLYLRKPHPRYFHRALEQTGARADQVVMVGDKYLRDVNGALNAGIREAYLVVPLGDHDLPLDELTKLREREANILWREFGIKLPAPCPSPTVLAA